MLTLFLSSPVYRDKAFLLRVIDIALALSILFLKHRFQEYEIDL